MTTIRTLIESIDSINEAPAGFIGQDIKPYTDPKKLPEKIDRIAMRAVRVTNTVDRLLEQAGFADNSSARYNLGIVKSLILDLDRELQREQKALKQALKHIPENPNSW